MSTVDVLSKLDPTLTQSSTTTAKKNNEIGKEQFLQMLVTQLKNQDPLDPMSNDRFAVDLAPFSELEQLMEINKKTTTSGSGEVASLAAYLGHEVILKQDSIDVVNGKGGSIGFDLPQDASSVTVEIMDGEGSTVDTVALGAAAKGRSTVELNGLGVADGEYNIRLTVRDATGNITHPDASFGGVVSGFIPGDDPVLLVGGKEVSPADVKEVRVAPETESEQA